MYRWNPFTNNLEEKGDWFFSGNTLGAKKTLGSIDNQDFGIITNNTERLTVLKDGNVGIGTKNPGYNLDILGSVNNTVLQVKNTTYNNSFLLTAQNNNVNVLKSTASFYFQGSNALSFTAGLGTNLGGISFQNSGSQTKVFFDVNNTGSGSYINTGNVGIGTTAPNQQLEITKNFRLPATVGTNAYGVIYKDGNRFIHDFNYGDNGTVTTNGLNIFIGNNAGNFTMGSSASATTHSSYNTGIGSRTLQNNTIGNNNSAIGVDALQYNTTGSSNSAIGGNALRYNTAGANNVAIGVNALLSNTTGSSNSAIGVSALLNNTTGVNNSAIGMYAGRYLSDGTTGRETGSNGLYLGYNSKASANGTNNEIVIGTNAIGKGSNTAVIGNNDLTALYVSGQIVPAKLSSEPTGIEGGIYYNTTDKHFYGYNGTTYVQLDN